MGCGNSTEDEKTTEQQQQQQQQQQEPVQDEDVDDGKGNCGKLICIPQNDTEEERKKIRADNIAKGKAEYEWGGADGFPKHVKALPPHEEDMAEKKWHKEQVFDVVKSGASMGLKWTADDVGDLFDKLLGKDEPPFEDYYNIYEKGKVPAVASRWQDDAEFARQKLQGILPIYIKKVPDEGLPSKFPVTAAHVEDFKGWPEGATLESMQKEDKLYWVDLEWMQSARDEDHTGVAMERNMCVPMMLFFVNEHNVLMPACVKLNQSEEWPIITSGGEDFVSNRWKVAKLLCTASEGCLHEVSNHLLMTHYIMEIVYVAMKRTTSVYHPVHELLSAHFWYTCFINRGARDTLTKDEDAAVPKIMSSGYQCMVNLLKKGWEDFSFEQYDLEADFKKRGVEKIPDYFYRDDAVKVQASIRSYVERILKEFYSSDEDVQGDEELAAFVTEMVDPANANLRGLPFTNGNKVETLDQLITFCTYVIWGCSGYHAVLNNGQYDYYGFVPAAPGIFNIKPETVNKDRSFTLHDISDAFPKKNMALYQVSFIHVLSLPTDQPLGQFTHDKFYFLHQPKCLEHLKDWQKELEELSKELEERNKALEKDNKVPYPYLVPSQIACSVAI